MIRLNFNPPTLIFDGSPKPMELRLTTTASNRPIFFQVQMNKATSPFTVSLPSDGLGVLLSSSTNGDGDGGMVKRSWPVQASSTCSDTQDLSAQNMTNNVVVIKWCAISLEDLQVIESAGEAKAKLLNEMWSVATKVGDFQSGVLEIPIEVFNATLTICPFQTWKDPNRWTDFVYRPGVENKAASFKPKSCTNLQTGFFIGVWDCEVTASGTDAEAEALPKEVVVKEIRIFGNSSVAKVDMKSLRQKFERSFLAYRKLDHKNVDIILGEMLEPEICIMTRPYKLGDVKSYADQGKPFLEGVETRTRLVHEVTEGLAYLHSQDIIHGDFRSYNVLVDDAGHAKITNYGLMGIIAAGTDLDKRVLPYDYEFQTPEFIVCGTEPLSQSDVYKYGLLLLELISGMHLFTDFNMSPGEVNRRMVVHQHLPGPTYFAERVKKRSPIWKLFARCCSHKPNARPPMIEVSRRLKEIDFYEEVYQGLGSKEEEEVKTAVPAKVVDHKKGGDGGDAKKEPGSVMTRLSGLLKF